MHAKSPTNPRALALLVPRFHRIVPRFHRIDGCFARAAPPRIAALDCFPWASPRPEIRFANFLVHRFDRNDALAALAAAARVTGLALASAPAAVGRIECRIGTDSTADDERTRTSRVTAGASHAWAGRTFDRAAAAIVAVGRGIHAGAVAHNERRGAIADAAEAHAGAAADAAIAAIRSVVAGVDAHPAACLGSRWANTLSGAADRA